jgi:uncharacterized coiled-coil protein SlyX
MAPQPAAPLPSPSRAEQALPALEAGLAEARAEIAALKQTVAELRGALSEVQGEVRSLKQALGA